MNTSFLDDDYDVLPVIDLNDDGRIISSTKAAYVDQYPKNIIAFDGTICTKSKGNIWFGDVDVTRDTPRLREIATELGEDLYIFLERDFVEEKDNIKWDDALKVIRRPRVKKAKVETTAEETTELDTTPEVETTTIEFETTEAEAIAETHAEPITEITETHAETITQVTDETIAEVYAEVTEAVADAET